MPWTDVLGYTASAAVLATFCTTTMRSLRILALVSNVLFIFYGYFDSLYPVLVLHAVLLPMNLLRLIQIRRSIEAESDGHQKRSARLPSTAEAGRIWAVVKRSAL